MWQFILRNDKAKQNRKLPEIGLFDRDGKPLAIGGSHQAAMVYLDGTYNVAAGSESALALTALPADTVGDPDWTPQFNDGYEIVGNTIVVPEDGVYCGAIAVSPSWNMTPPNFPFLFTIRGRWLLPDDSESGALATQADNIVSVAQAYEYRSVVLPAAWLEKDSKLSVTVQHDANIPLRFSSGFVNIYKL